MTTERIRSAATFCVVHPTSQNTKNDILVEGPILVLSAVHAKQRRDGYRGSGADDG